MQLWFSRGSAISIREQLSTQIILGIVSGDLAPGQRLPSTRELARRFHLHPNTVSAGYRQLQLGNWVEFRKGSGVYVRGQDSDPPSSALALDQQITKFFRFARTAGIPLSEVRSRLRHWLDLQPPDHFLLIEKDAALARIVTHEIQNAVATGVKTCSYEECGRDGVLLGAIPVALAMNAATVRDLLPDDADVMILQLRSAGGSLAPYLPAPSTSLIAVASGWPTFLKIARTMLIAAGFDPDCLILRHTGEANWRRGLNQAGAVICDTLTAGQLSGSYRLIPFPLLADSSVKELRDHIKFIQNPLGS